MAIKMTNNAASTLASNVSSGATSFTVVSGSSFPTFSSGDHSYVTIGTEVIKVTARNSAVFTCIATGASHSAGDTVELRVTAELLNDFSTDAESLAKAGGEMSGNITMAGSQTVDGRDLSADGSKLDGIDTGAKNDQTAAEIKTLLEDGIDSVHYVNGSIDTEHIADDQVTAALLANSINTDIATGVTANTTANAALPKSGGTMTGAITSASDFTIDAAGDINLDADGADIKLKDAGTLFASLVNASGDFKIVSETSDKDMIFRGNDGGNFITALTLDMSEAGKATFNSSVVVGANAVGTLTTDNDGSFAMSASNNFKCTPGGNFALTFTSIVAQSGNILFINSGGHTISAHANTKVDATLLATISTAGTYLLAYFSDGTNVYMTNSAAYT